ncbi:S-adenosylmethionine:tRNA ribosyltransferase-isomerase [Flavihumibacter profundi]|uniref:S-adenosylmethionine:tRNA ribosyltransferase-isomerase n=1 Tax=Flavihumibacter profundi TaxID=2716883 RepID=UPI001CC7A004|nr:S-adenosylmethionine:tRNA ribosyltransferase-isomerase [Flavihumibacter profundi]MBZ5858226.1 S-adenosylmethionine:tRNA ribosyltransferase-isomerase [Flavihumibacter profundi]
MTTPPHPRDIAIADFIYDLPEHRIANFPLNKRDASKLLVYSGGQITESTYRNLAQFIPENYLLVFNKTRVVEARLFFTKSTGAVIEIFCLEPHPQYPDISSAMGQTHSVKWNCLVGGAAKWKTGQVLEKTLPRESGNFVLKASLQSRNGDNFTILFEWTPAGLSFAEILHYMGVIPIPPYLKRASTRDDLERYQTIYAEQEGSVAAPTAGLHFTDEVFTKLREKNIHAAYVTLHVGAGTFKPVKSELIANHEMHAEFIDVDRNTISSLLAANGKIIAVGTTSLRTLESLYWMGVKAILYAGKKLDSLAIGQWEVYDELLQHAKPVEEALLALLSRMDQQSTDRILCKTQIMIAPGYKVKMVKALITNFHQPQSTLLLLVSALIGSDWKKIYNYALEHEFRFLSYGDGSLIWVTAS